MKFDTKTRRWTLEAQERRRNEAMLSQWEAWETVIKAEHNADSELTQHVAAALDGMRKAIQREVNLKVKADVEVLAKKEAKKKKMKED